MITAAMVFVAGGILVSDEALGWLDRTIGSESVRWVAEATLTVVLFSDASRIDLGALRPVLAPLTSIAAANSLSTIPTTAIAWQATK